MKSVYLIRSNDGRYKIGIAKNPEKRIRQLQTGNSDTLKLITSYRSENANKIEKALHRYYSYGKMIGEWFDLSIKEEAEFTKMCCRVDEAIILSSVQVLDGY
jgi:predicted GIY-YIG superfamily endonuclease